ncbi:MAG: hypothetical protein GY796_19720, partial [Chloroflexi bacterium]|nr:hypothetical protein [Chloroflexota bacterium]
MQRSLLLTVSTLLGVVLFWGFQQKLEAAEGIAATPAQLSSEPITLIPAQLFLQGDVATSANAEGHCPEPWLSDMPPGSIILGVDPTSCDPSNWDGGAVTAEFFLPNPYTLTVMLLQLEWPDQESKGLHSPERNQTATITLDGRSIWSQRTAHLRANGDYYATGHNTILTTFVLTQSITHTLSISVPAQTAWDLSE